MIRLRTLDIKDAEYMLEWMHDSRVVRYLAKDFSKMSIKDCEDFIAAAVTMSHKPNDEQLFLHLAIVDDDDEYLGTVSLKDINRAEKSAEFGISTRQTAWGKNYAKEAMRQIIDIGFSDYDIEKIYWYVSIDNKRAMRFYEKNGYKRVDVKDLKLKSFDTETINPQFAWFIVEKNG